MKNKMFFWIDFLSQGTKTTVSSTTKKKVNLGKKKGTFGSRESFQWMFPAFRGTKLCPLPLANILPLLVMLAWGKGRWAVCQNLITIKTYNVSHFPYPMNNSKAVYVLYPAK